MRPHVFSDKAERGKPESFSSLATTLMFRYLAAGEKPEEQNYTPLYILTSECLD